MHIKATNAAAAAVLAASAMIAGTSQADARPTAAACQPAWHLVPLPQPDNPPPVVHPQFFVAAPSIIAKNDIWLSTTYYSPVVTYQSWLLHSNGGAATVAPQVPGIPENKGKFAATTAFDAASDGWSFGRYSTMSTYLDYAAHWHGGRWTITPLVAQPDETTGTQVHAAAALSPDSAWAVGGIYHNGVGPVSNTDAAGALIEHWDGTQWSAVPNPAASRPGAWLAGINARTASDIWAVGQQSDPDGNDMPLVEHWNGTQWTEITAPAGNQGSALYSVSADAPDDVWAVGAQTLPGTTDAAAVLAEHWDGSRWSIVTSLPDFGNTYLGSVYAASPTDVWATTRQGLVPGASKIVHWDGKTWTVTQAPGPKGSELAYHYDGYGGGGGVSGIGHDVWASGYVYDYATLSAMPQLAHLSCAKGGS